MRQAAAEPDEAPLDPAVERVHRKLRRLLVVSGLIMVLGFVAVFATIIYRVAGSGSGAQVEALVESVTLPPQVKIISAVLGDRSVSVTLSHPDGRVEVVRYDLRSGNRISALGLIPGP